MDKGWKSFEMHAKNMDVEGNSGDFSERKEMKRKPQSSQRISNCGQNVDRNMDGKGHFEEVSDGNEEHVIGNWRKGISCYQVAKNLVELCQCSSVLWKVAMELKVWLDFWLIIIKCKKREMT